MPAYLCQVVDFQDPAGRQRNLREEALCVMKKFLTVASLSLALGAAAFAQSSKPAASAGNTPELPTVDQILKHYEEAIGGRAAWQKITSRFSLGTIDVPAMGLSGSVLIQEKAPDRMLVVITLPGGAFRQGFDGKVGWSEDPQTGLREMTGEELAETRRDADFYHAVKLREHFARLSVVSAEKIGEQDTYLMEVFPAEGEPEKMYFDAKTGLLVRVTRLRHSVDGAITVEGDLGDYREVDGIKVPFRIHQTSSESSFTITLQEMRHNVPIEDSLFKKPAAQ